MEGVLKDFANICLKAVIGAYRELLNMPLAQALSSAKYGKSDTLGLDGGPEIAVYKTIHGYQDNSLLVTEESDDETGQRWPIGIPLPMVFICDPTDRSKFLRAFLEHFQEPPDSKKTIGKLVEGIDCDDAWNKLFLNKQTEHPLSIVGPMSAITCVRRGKPFFSAIVNYLTGQIFIAGPTGVFTADLPNYQDAKALAKVTFDTITHDGRPLHFLSAEEMCATYDDHLRFATYLGKAGYQENFDATAIFLGRDPKSYLHHSEPGGPSRVLYLSELQKGHGPMGFVMSNGEKIGEFVHWLPFAIYGRTKSGHQALSIHEISIERPWTKSGVLMSTSPPYSIFQRHPDGAYYLDVGRLRKFDHPSHFRSTIVVTQADNSALQGIMGTNCYREIDLS